MRKLIYILTTFTVIISLISCCPKCKECITKINYEWKIPHNSIDIINMHNDTLIGSEIFYKSNPNCCGNIQYVKDKGHYIIDKNSGIITDSICGFVPKTAENKYLSVVGLKNTHKFLFETEISQFELISDFKGYRIVIEEWYKNIRTTNNHVYSVIIFKGNKKVLKKCLPSIYDFTYDKEALYLYSNNEIYKFKFDKLIKRDK